MAALALRGAPLATAFASTAAGTLRCINVVNFIRLVESRFAMDMLQPVREQMALVLRHGLPATWLLQFDALVDGPFVGFLKQHMADNHEVGFWFEMNQKICAAAGIPWRGRPDYEWDPDPKVAFTIGYTPDERIRLADAAMKAFHSTWGRYPRSVASWNLDALVVQHLADRYGVDAFAVCRDQIATDGFTIWGAPIAGYYPSKTNAWSPALNAANQVDAPVFRMLGQDPVYYYTKQWRLPDGTPLQQPDTIEPVWVSGRSTAFVDAFLAMLARGPSLGFAYAQLGQENTFSWDQQAQAYPMQMAKLAKLRDEGALHVETMESSGRRFKQAFRQTPAQAQVQLVDPFGNTEPVQRSIWYQSRFYRANLHFRGNIPFLRDITVYSDRFAQPFLHEPTQQKNVEQKMLAVLDGYHWSRHPGAIDDDDAAGGYFLVNGERLVLTGIPVVTQTGQSLVVTMSVGSGRVLTLRFDEQAITCELAPRDGTTLEISFQWDPAKAAFRDVTPASATYRWQAFDYRVVVRQGRATKIPMGWKVSGERTPIVLGLAQHA
ncbi:hypothetical protein [Pinirhizobacter soli]|uniref:hypothetical protein n=1 Tax=Pinirhizobacter soli TaxID=2786953 RepID=UPI00202A83BF|nr:hypothetical protein [Pinirhizobacter soli]